MTKKSPRQHFQTYFLPILVPERRVLSLVQLEMNRATLLLNGKHASAPSATERVRLGFKKMK